MQSTCCCLAMWVAIPAQSFDLRFVPSACIRVSGTTISDLQNSRDSPNTSNCGIPKICWSCGGGHEHIGMAASHGTAQFRSNLPSKGFWARGLSRCSGAGVGQPVKSRTYRAGGGWNAIPLVSKSWVRPPPRDE